MCSFLWMKIKRKLKSCVYLTTGRLRTEIQQHVRKLCKTLGLVISYHVLVNPTQSGIYCTVRLTLLKLWYMHMSIHSSFYQKYDIAILVYVNVWKRGEWKFFSGFEDRNYINTLTVVSTGIAKDTKNFYISKYSVAVCVLIYIMSCLQVFVLT